MAYIELDISQNDIDESTEQDENSSLPTPWVERCPVARAGKRSIPNFDHVGQRFLAIIIDGDYGYYKVELPQQARDFIRSVDAHRSVRRGLAKRDEFDVDQEPLKPISFSVYIPDEYVRRGI